MLYFSLFSGEIFDSPTELSDAFQIPLKQLPKSTCPKCYGRFYKSYSITNKQFEICNKCVKKCVDADRLIKRLSTDRLNSKIK